MPRVKASEYTAKKILATYTNTKFSGIGVRENDQKFSIPSGKKYVVKVDDGSKRRMKRGLVNVDVSAVSAKKFVEALKKKRFSKFYIEPFVEHNIEDEQYISIDRVREGYTVMYSKSGGINIEDSKDSLVTFTAPKAADLVSSLIKKTDLSEKFVRGLVEYFDNEHISFLEINPFVVKGNKVYALDLAVERDSAADFFVSPDWQDPSTSSGQASLEVEGPKQKVQALAETTPASLSLEVINKDANVFMLLSGGGASLVLADAAHHKKHPEVLANYGEYSGNPTREVVREYAGIILDMALRSKAKKKAIVIAGGVANFTDILQTFSGIVDALEPRATKLKQQKIKVYVRRGGPNEEAGREMLKKFLESRGLLGSIGGSKIPLTKVMDQAIDYVT